MSDDSEKLLPVLPVDPPVRGTCGPDDRASASVDPGQDQTFSDWHRSGHKRWRQTDRLVMLGTTLVSLLHMNEIFQQTSYYIQQNIYDICSSVKPMKEAKVIEWSLAWTIDKQNSLVNCKVTGDHLDTVTTCIQCSSVRCQVIVLVTLVTTLPVSSSCRQCVRLFSENVS